jgi:ubiquinone/menaquinone biosynthesis C-methylase UbiE
VNVYDQFAELYDLEHRDLSADLPLYTNFAARCDGPVLEVGCGSGRVCLALAQAGIDVLGIDPSAEMLSLARARAASLGLEQSVQFEQADVRDLAYEDRFVLVLFALNGFLHLLTLEDQLQALHCMARALLPGGFLIVDLPNPHTVFVAEADGQPLLRRRFSSPEGTSWASYTTSETDLAEQRQSLTLTYEQEGTGERGPQLAVEMVLRYVYRHEMALLLQQSGLTVDAVYGTYDLDPYTDYSSQMVFVAYRPFHL